MPDVPSPNFIDLLAETWFPLSYAAYHMAYVRIYTQSNMFLYKKEVMHQQKEDVRVGAQEDLVICRANLSAFFMQLEHVFESVRRTVKKFKKDLPNFFVAFEPWLDEQEKLAMRLEIRDYRNHGHQIPAIIGAKWDGETLSHLFLPHIDGHAVQDDVELNERLRRYFEFTANIWLKLIPNGLEDTFPLDFNYPVTIPALYAGELPPGLENVRQLFVTVKAFADRAEAPD